MHEEVVQLARDPQTEEREDTEPADEGEPGEDPAGATRIGIKRLLWAVTGRHREGRADEGDEADDDEEEEETGQ
jgi:hypothetical protein